MPAAVISQELRLPECKLCNLRIGKKHFALGIDHRDVHYDCGDSEKISLCVTVQRRRDRKGIGRLPLVQQIVIFKPENLWSDHFVGGVRCRTADRQSARFGKGTAADGPDRQRHENNRMSVVETPFQTNLFPSAPSYYTKRKSESNLLDKQQARPGFASRSMDSNPAQRCKTLSDRFQSSHLPPSLAQIVLGIRNQRQLRFTICAKSMAIRSRSCRACESASICLWPSVVTACRAVKKQCEKQNEHHEYANADNQFSQREARCAAPL